MRVGDYKTGSSAAATNIQDFCRLLNSWTIAEQCQPLVPLKEAWKWGREGQTVEEERLQEISFGLWPALEVEGGVQRGRRGKKGVSCSRSRWRTLGEEWSSMSSMQRGSGTIREQVTFCKNLRIHRIYLRNHMACYITCSGHVSSTYVERLKGISLVVRSEVVTTHPPKPSFYHLIHLW